jgi:hypothetical protein
MDVTGPRDFFPLAREASIRSSELILGLSWHTDARVVGLGFFMLLIAGDIEIFNRGTESQRLWLG